jgi:predicted RNA binding protein YcfA (HicA-like mRNA interferase family)
MSKIPRISGQECVNALLKIGFVLKRQLSQLVVPDHKELDRGTLRSILRQADIGIEEFIRLLF